MGEESEEWLKGEQCGMCYVDPVFILGGFA